jgi:ArsR family transcriptional regulator
VARLFGSKINSGLIIQCGGKGMELVEVLKVLGDENRIRILNLLKDGELCVCEMESILELNQSNVSRHLTRLSTVKLIKSYKKAQFIYYTINAETISNYGFIREILMNEVNKIEGCKHDTKMLRRFKECNISCDNIECGKGI